VGSHERNLPVAAHHAATPDAHRRALTNRARDLGDGLDLGEERLEVGRWGVALEDDVVDDRGRPLAAGREVAVVGNGDPGQRQAAGIGLAIQVVRDARGDRQVQELAAVETSAARLPTIGITRRGPIGDERERPRPAERGRSPVDGAKLDSVGIGHG
jgi:hypothetical protein